MGDGYNWADPKNAEHPESASIPLPINATPSKVPKTAIVQVPTAPPPPELATTYIEMWARFADGATLPDPLLRIFQSQRYMLDASIVRSAVLGYGLIRHIAITNEKVVDRHAISAFLTVLATFQQQRPLFASFWAEVLTRTPDIPLDNWREVCWFARHPSSSRAAFGISFIAPTNIMQPWAIQTGWTLNEFAQLLRRIHPSLVSLRRLVDYADFFVRTRNAGGPLAGHPPLPNIPNDQRYPEPFADSPPIQGAFVTEQPPPSSSAGPMEVDSTPPASARRRSHSSTMSQTPTKQSNPKPTS